ncbi:MAG: flagellin [Planctomycetota bacterium]|nr:MAG: flagellin [Planctomycetota bacterium]
MTRINTNISSLNAQKTLARSNASLQESLTRLSTGLRINVGKDDPAGLIASETLRADITSVEKAITNSERANQMIATADSALGQVSSLLNDIRGLVSEAANTGALSSEQIAANQLQIDSSLEAIDRIANVTQFQGQRLLDGSLDFITSGVDSDSITGLQIDQANFGSLSQIDVNVNVVSMATKASLNYNKGALADDVVLEVGGKDGFEAFNFAAGSTIEDIAQAINLVSDALGVTATVQTEATAGEVVASSFGTENDITITANTAGEEAGDIRVKYVKGTTSTTSATYTAASGNDPAKLVVTLGVEEWAAASGQVDDASDVNNAIQIDADIAGTEFNGVTINVTDTGGAITLSYDHDTKTLNIGINDGVTTADQLVTAINNDARISALFTASHVGESDGSGTLSVAGMNAAGLTLSGGVDGGTVTATANDVVSAINSAAGSYVTAALADGNNGYGTVSEFQEYAYYGDANANNRLQFLGPEGSRNIRFVSNPGESLSVDLTTDPQVTGFASAVVQGVNANSSIEITSRFKGADYDDVNIVFNDDTSNTVVWDAENKTLTFNVDISGGYTAQNVVDLLNNDDYAGKFFRASNFGTSDGSGNIDATMTGTLATTSGGIESEGTIIVHLATTSDGIVTTTAQDLIDYFDDPANAATLQSLGISVSNAEGSDGSGLLAATTSDLEFATSGTQLEDAQASGTTYAQNGKNARIQLTAVQPGTDYDGVQLVFEDTATAGSETVSWDAATKTLTIGIEDGVSTATQVINAINNDATASALFTAATGGGGDGSGTVTISDYAVLSGGQVDNGTQDGVALLGNSDEQNTGLTFEATEYGSDAFVSVKALSGTFETTDADGNVATRVSGTDVNVQINGIEAVGNGLSASVNTSSLDLTLTLSSSVSSGSTLNFSITSGGAQFQLGPDVVSNQQARIGIQSVNTAKLGSSRGRLSDLRSGGSKSLTNDVIGAAAIVEDVITQVTTLRGRLGAFQRTTLETNIAALNDTLENLTAAESDIRDADFAAESAKLTRAQILVQSGTSVLSIANSNPQAVLSLLR